MTPSEHGSRPLIPIDARLATPQDLAGAQYEKMTQSKQATMAFLTNSDYRVRLGAILICEQTWDAVRDPSVIDACRAIAMSDADESTRLVAIGILGRAFRSSKDKNASRFVAGLIIDSGSSPEVRTRAYWALREIQYGIADVDFDTFFKGTIKVVDECLKLLPSTFSTESVKAALLPNGRSPDECWASANDIDWDFVHRMARE